MADLPFWQQMVLAITEGIVASGIIVFFGARFFRAQEQARNEEAARSDLARLQRSLILDTAAAIGEHLDARMEHLALRRWEQAPPESVEEAAAKDEEASRRFWSVFLKNQLLVPPAVCEALLAANTAIAGAATYDELMGASSALARQLAPFFADLLKAPIDFVPPPPVAPPAEPR